MTAIILFGAALWPGGRPSPTLSRRIGWAAAAANVHPHAPVFCSGGVGRHGPSEASVMAERLRDMGLAAERLVLDEASRDTLQNVVAACRFLRARDLSECLACTDPYHLPRVRMLFAALDIRARAAPGVSSPLTAYGLRMAAREALAFPYDLAVVLARRRQLRREIERP